MAARTAQPVGAQKRGTQLHLADEIIEHLVTGRPQVQLTYHGSPGCRQGLVEPHMTLLQKFQVGKTWKGAA